MAERGLSYDEAKAQLEEIALRVRKKETSLDKSLDLLEEGVRLANACVETIDQTHVRPPEPGDEPVDEGSDAPAEAAGEPAEAVAEATEPDAAQPAEDGSGEG